MNFLPEAAAPVLYILIVGTALGAMAKEWLRPVQSLGLAAVACVACGMVQPAVAASKLTHPVVIIVSLIVAMTSVMVRGDVLVRWISRIGGTTQFARLRVLAAIGAISAVLSNTAIVAAVIRAFSLQSSLVPANLLLPLSYVAIIGGTMTLIGTSTNLVVSGLWQDAGGPGLEFLHLLPVGALCLVVCLPLLLWLSRALPSAARTEGVTSGVWCLEAVVEPDSPLVGRTVEEAGLRRIGSHYLVRLIRAGTAMEPVPPSEVLAAGDLVQFVGEVGDPTALAEIEGLNLNPEGAPLPPDANLCFAVVPRSSPLVDHSLKGTGFRSRFEAAAVAIARGGERLRGGLGDVRIEAGDALILLMGKGSRALLETGGWVRILSETEAEAEPNPHLVRLFWAAAAAVLVAAAFGQITLLAGFMGLGVLVLLTRLMSLQRLYRALPVELALTLASGLVLSDAMRHTGVDALAASALLAVLPENPWLAFAAVFFFAVAVTELVTNAAAAAIVLPVALEISRLLGLQPLPFVLAVVYGASGSFMTPHGYQTNLMVQAVLGYSWARILRSGAPVLLAYSAAAIAGTGLWFGFQPL